MSSPWLDVPTAVRAWANPQSRAKPSIDARRRLSWQSQFTNLRAFLNSRIQPLYSPASSGRQEFCM